MLSKIIDFINKNSLFSPGDNILAAVSGGPDSVCLLHVLFSLQKDLALKRLGIFHLDHLLRGAESDADVKFVIELASQFDIPVIIKSRDIKAYAKQHKLSIEEAAREVRFDELLKTAKDKDYSVIALGHTADDQVETVLMRLIRGTGSKGLIGIQPKRKIKNMQIVRPLLSITREEILAYLAENSISFRTDSSNLTGILMRNKIRRDLIPLLEKDFNREIKTILRRFAEIQEAEYTFISQYADEIYKKISREQENNIYLSIPRLLGQSKAIQMELIRNAINNIKGDTRNITFKHINDSIKLLNGKTGKYICLPDSLYILKEYDHLIISKEKSVLKTLEETRLNVPGITEIDRTGISIAIDNKKKTSLQSIKKKKVSLKSICQQIKLGKTVELKEFVDADKTGTLLTARSREDGDRYRPFGLQGTRKIKDIFIDEKIPVTIRDYLPLICTKDKIIYLTGYRITEEMKVTQKTKNILQITIKIQPHHRNE